MLPATVASFATKICSGHTPSDQLAGDFFFYIPCQHTPSRTVINLFFFPKRFSFWLGSATKDQKNRHRFLENIFSSFEGCDEKQLGFILERFTYIVRLTLIYISILSPSRIVAPPLLPPFPPPIKTNSPHQALSPNYFFPPDRLNHQVVLVT